MEVAIGGVLYGVISVYAPIEDKTEKEKCEFYSEIDSALENMSRSARENALVCGDFNAAVGPMDNAMRNDLIGPFVGKQIVPNENNSMFMQCCISNGLSTASTFFDNQERGTFKPVGKVEFTRTIDHILCARKVETVARCGVMGEFIM